ncbi:glycosyltransferase [Cohnella cellulosilytica]|uniref:Glycosyltransferase n=1 Tax=Cohnella cellulosilytica TaxID=986710 RepID=A0ABW2FJF4_9BACL
MSQSAENKISIITATYNSERYLEDTIKSVLQQSAYDRLEFIIVDGGSTDRTLNIISVYRDLIHIVISEPDAGIYDAFNKGIRAATGNIVYFLNSDDYLHDKTVISDVLAEFDSDPSNRAIYGHVLIVNEKIGLYKPYGHKTTLANLQLGRNITHQAIFVKKSVFDEFGLFELKYRIASDFDANVKLFKKYEANCVFINRAIAVFRTGGTSTDIANLEEVRRDLVQICTKHFGKSVLQPLTRGEMNGGHYKKWVETLLLDDKPISKTAFNRGIRSVAIFGTIDLSLYMLIDLEKSGIQVQAFLDNDRKIQGASIRGITVYAPEWLVDHGRRIDAIILAFEYDYDAEIRDQISNLLGEAAPPIYSWKQFVVWNQ